MANVKSADIKKLSTTKREFVFALKRVSQSIEKSGSLKGGEVKSG